MMSSVARVKFIKTKVIFRYYAKGVSNQVSSISDLEIKSYWCSKSSTKMGKTKKLEKISSVRKRGKELQAGVALRITNQGRDFKSGQRLQIGARGILNRGRFWTHHTIPILEQYEYDAAILHVGINDLLRFDKNSSTLVLICDDIINANLRGRYFNIGKVFVSSVVFCSKVTTDMIRKPNQPSRGVPRKRCSENMQQISRRTPMP